MILKKIIRYLADLLDVEFDTGSPNDNDILRYDGSTGVEKWKPEALDIHSQNTDTILQGTGKTIDQSQTVFDSGVYEFEVDSGKDSAQTFKAGLTGDLTEILLKIYKYGSTDPLIIEIRTTDIDGKPTTTVLETYTMQASEIELMSTWTDKLIIFSSPVSIIAGTTYAIVFRSIDNDQYFIGTDDRNNSYVNGTYYDADAGLENWDERTNYDLYFKIFVETSSNIDIINSGTLKTNLVVDDYITVDGRDISVDGIKLDTIEEDAVALDTVKADSDIADAITKKHTRSHTIDSSDDHSSSITEDNIIIGDANGLPKDSGKDISTDGTLGDNSDNSLSTEKAIKTYVDGGLLNYLLRTEWKQNGFENRTDSELIWTDTSPDRTLSIQPTATAGFTYWVEGVEYTSSGDTRQITDVEGIHLIYYDDDTLTSIANPTNAQIISIIKTKAWVSTVYWNATTKEGIYIGEERHGKSMSPETHSYLHFTEGLKYLSGLGLNTISADQNASDNAHAQFGVDLGRVSDEDLSLDISAIVSTTGLPIYYMTGASPIWNKEINSGYSVIKTGATGEDRLAYNEYTGGVWKLTEVSNLQFVLCHIFATTEKDTPMIAILGQASYSTKKNAQAGALTEINELVLNDILFPETRPIATVIFQTRDTYSNDMKARIVSTEEGDDYVDWRNEVISRVEISTSDHNSLTGKQGGTVDEYYHITSAEYTALNQWLDNINLEELTDVDFDSGTPLDRYALIYDGSTGVEKWKAGFVSYDDLTDTPSLSQLHNQQHDIDATDDHNGVAGAVEDNFLSFDASGLPQDSGFSDEDFGIGVDDVDDFTIKYENSKLKLADRIEQNIFLNAFLISINGSLTEHDMIDGMRDVYVDESGIDTGTGGSTGQIYDADGDFYEPDLLELLEIDYCEYATDEDAQSAWESSDPDSGGSLNVYSESSIKEEGSYSLKLIADITDSLNQYARLDFGTGTGKDLSPYNTIKFDIRASRPGTNFQLRIHDSGGTTITKDVDIATGEVDTWKTINWDLHTETGENLDDIDWIDLYILDADEENIIYIDNIYAYSFDSDLIAYYKMDDNLATTVVIDEIGAHNGTLNGGDNTEDLSSAGHEGLALDFNGLDDVIVVSDDAELNFGTGEFTLTGYVDTDATQTDVIGDIINKFDKVNKIGFNLNVKHNTCNYRQLSFGMDNNHPDSIWVEVAPKLGAESRIYSLAVFNGKLYGGTYGNGKLYEWNGSNAWVEKAPKLGTETFILSLAVYNGKLYGGTGLNGKLYEWNGSNAWVEVADKLGDELEILSLAVYNGKLYGGTRPNGKLYEWNGSNAWVEVAPKLGAESHIYSLAVFNGKLYGGTRGNGKLYEWNGSNAWVEKAPKLGTETYIYSLAVYNGKLYGGTHPNGKLYEWNGSNAWVEVAPKLGAETRIWNLAVYNGKLYGGMYPNGKLYEWDEDATGGGAWVQVAGKLGTETQVWSLAVYKGKLYGGTYPNGKLYEWKTGIATTYDYELNSGEQYITAVKDNTSRTLKLYVNAVLVSESDTFTVADYDLDNTEDLLIGFGIQDYFKGKIDELRIYNKALNSDEITALYNPSAITNMTLISEKFTADSEPEQARIVLWEEDVTVLTLNTDLKAYISKDDGVTWAEITLTNEGNVESPKKILSGIVDLTQSGIGSGTDMRYKIISYNNKNLKIHAGGISWN